MKNQEDVEQEELECSKCKSHVNGDDEFCPECGTIFEDEIMCSIHTDKEASGVCTICCLSFCEECGAETNKRFLCNSHSGYEIYQGMARVFGDLDDTKAQYVKTCLEQAGLHPIIYCKVQPKGGTRLVYTLFEANGDSGGHIVNEVKVMVPCQEVVTAEDTLRELKVIK
jgi:RNA polymerase subunit RPABC4/transcription elongation factor Spt4